jgi:hypothetical protein
MLPAHRHPETSMRRPLYYVPLASSIPSAWPHPITSMSRRTTLIQGKSQMDGTRPVPHDLYAHSASLLVYHCLSAPPISTCERTYSDKDQSFTSPSPPPVAKFRPSSLMPTVAEGCHAAPPILSVCPLFVDTAFRFGRSQIFESPVQDVVRMYCELGEKRNVDSGRSSPNWDPRLLKDCEVSLVSPSGETQLYLHFLIQLLPSIDDLS